MHLRRHRRPQEPQLGAREEGHGSWISPWSLLIHDLERAHYAFVRDVGLESEAHRADVNDPVYMERMEVTNDLCAWLKRYLWRFTGMSPRYIQAHDRWDQTARLVRHNLIADTNYRRLRLVRYHTLSKLFD